ncbi:LysE family translocator [Pollutibacter soli]|uniref:LysE family translocator n=1 Tax=Pollutibacter soli TaxID=3034157 RepID=UPI003013F890
MIIHFETFLIAGILLNLTPGNDTIFILSKSIGQGRKAGIVSALGIAAGTVVHTLMAALGLSIIIAKSLLLFNIIKYAGAAYLLYIGYKMITDRGGLQFRDIEKKSEVNYRVIFRDAVITNVLNPKVGLFFISFLPQFINPASASPVTGFLLLGLTFICTGLTWCAILALFSSAIFNGLKQHSKFSSWVNRMCGATIISLGIKVAFTDRK